MLDSWLDWALDDHPPTQTSGSLSGGTYQLLAPGVMGLTPAHIAPAAHACIFSAAIHGNETAPVEILGAWLAELESGHRTLNAPVLVILGNLPALKQQTRFVSTNLNRLFDRQMQAEGAEPDRARELMAQVDAFYARHSALPKLHYDLHTAIRESRYPRFVVEPFAATPTEEAQWQWLAGAGMQAVLHQHRPSATFSRYSKHYHGAQAFTFELGRVAAFGQNDLAPLAPMQRLLGELSEGKRPTAGDASALAFFRVECELMRESDDFRFFFADDVANFTRFEPGTPIAYDASAGETLVGETPWHVVFPNARVERGARAALLAVEVDR